MAICVNWERTAKALIHPLKVSILELLEIDGGRVLSVKEISEELFIGLSHASYHVSVLRDADLIELVREGQARGAAVHFYALKADQPEEGRK